MKFANLSNQSFVVSRMSQVSGDKIAMTTVTSGILGHYQPLGLEKTQITKF